jgi:hypothetical protein
MERVVFTSSVTAVFWSADHKQQQQLVDEKCWSDLAFCKKFKVFPLIVSVRASTSFSTRVKERMNEPPGSLVVATRFQVKQASHAIYLFIYILPCPALSSVACASKEFGASRLVSGVGNWSGWESGKSPGVQTLQSHCVMLMHAQYHAGPYLSQSMYGRSTPHETGPVVSLCPSVPTVYPANGQFRRQTRPVVRFAETSRLRQISQLCAPASK